MATVQIGRWKIVYNADATRKAYAQIAQGFPEQCGCETCKNFAAARSYAYPLEVKTTFEQLGIDTNKEPEVYHNGRLESGLHSYSGWFHFIGSIINGGDAQRQVSDNTYEFDVEQVTESFAIGLTGEIHLLPASFGDQPVVQIEFQTKIPWLIDSKEAE